MKKLIVIANFNADASCLSTKKWLQILSGGEHSLPDTIEGNLHYKFYPIHSSNFWLKEFRMLNYVQQIKELENRIFSLSNQEKYLWL